MPATKKLEFLRDILLRHDGELDKISKKYFEKPEVLYHFSHHDIGDYLNEIENLVSKIKTDALECAKEMVRASDYIVQEKNKETSKVATECSQMLRAYEVSLTPQDFTEYLS